MMFFDLGRILAGLKPIGFSEGFIAVFKIE